MMHARILPLSLLIGLICSNAAGLGQAASAHSAIESSEPAPAPRIIESIDDARPVVLRGNTHPLARKEFDRGLVRPELRMGDLVLVLRRGDEQQLAFDRFVASEYDPVSANYHRWLEPEEVGERFGPAQSDIGAISNWLSSHGFAIDEVSKDRLSIRFSGTAQQVQETFHTEIHQLSVTRGRLAGEQHIANLSDPQIPVALAPVVVGVKALHNFFPHPLHRLGGQVALDRASGQWRHVQVDTVESKLPLPALVTSPKPQFGTTDPYGNPVEDVAPYDFATIYNVLPLWQASTPIDGTGQKIAIAGTSNINLTDVAAFRTAFGLPAKAPTVLITNNDPGNCPTFADSCAGDLVENTLDVEWAGAVAKGASIVLVTSSPTSPTSDALYLSESYIVQNKTAPVMNVSYGQCEVALGTAGNTQYNNLWQTAAAEGIAVFVASGDAGSPACDQGFDAIYGVPYPAQFGLAVSGLTSTPYDTSVGGTDFNWGGTAAPYWNSSNSSTTKASAAGYIPEVPWNSSCVNPLVLPALQSDAAYLGVSGVVDAESACNFVLESGEYIQTNFGVNLAGLVDTIGGGGGRSNCTVSNGANPGSCTGGYAKPGWQAGVTGIPNDSVRDVPDVSFFASNGFLGSSYLICVSGGGNACTYSATTEPVAQEVGGTSVASPAMAGIMALINQKSGASQGNPNTLLYTLAAKQTYANCSTEKVKASSSSCIFNDIDTGTNAMACGNDQYFSSYGCPDVLYPGDPLGILFGFSAGTGFDLATGLGSINVANLVNNLPTTTAAVTLSPTSLSFASTTLNTASAAQTLSLKNSGKSTLTLSGAGQGIGITGTNASSFTQTNNCGTSLAAAASCTITVTFKPTVAGSLTASVSVGDNAYGSPQTVALSGTGAAAAPVATLSAQSLGFGSTAVGSTNTAPSITLSNSGSGPLSITSIAITGSNANQYSQTNTCGTSLAAGASCGIVVTFKPTAAGSSTAALSVTDNAPGSPQSVAISGTATGSGTTATVSPASLTFASTAVGVAAATQKVTVTNTSSTALSFSGTGKGITIAGTNATSFSQTNTCGTSIPANTACTITVTFKPTVSGSLSASVNIADSATNSPQTVALAGTGASSGAAAVTLSATTLTFPSTAVGTSAATQKVTLTNTGGAALSLSGTGQGISIGGVNAKSFTQTNTCGTSVAAGASCAITVTFTPTTTGALTAGIAIADSATGSPQKVTLSGTGGAAASAVVTLSPTSLSFASTSVGSTAATQTVILKNSGTAALSLNGTGQGISVGGTNASSFSQTNTCGTSVAAGASCSINVTFKPATTGSLTAGIAVADNASGSPQKIALSGTGSAATSAKVTLSATALSYAATTVGTAAATQSVTLTNSGTAALSLNGTNQGITIGGVNAKSFTQTNTCGTSVAAGGSCTITVTFKPTATGALTAGVGIADNATGSPQKITLSGTGK